MIDDELRTLLSADPSPDFASRIRARVRVDGTPARWPGRHSAVLAMAAAVAVAIGLGFLSRAGRHTDPATSPPAIAHHAPSVLAPSASAQSGVVVPPNGEAPVRRRAASPIAVSIEPPASRTTVQIDRAESLALRRLFASPVAGAVVDVAPLPLGELVIPQISIEPLTLDIRSEGASQ